MSDYPLGAIQSPPDARDFQISTILPPAAVAPPPSYFAAPVPPVLTQIGPTCVGWSSTTMRMQAEYRQKHRWYPLSANWLYEQCKRIDGIPGIDGTYVRCAMSVLKNMGQPLNTGAGMGEHKIRAYYAIPRTEAEIKNAIVTLGAVVVAGPWYESWFTPKASTGWVLPAPDKPAGGHAYMLNGWDASRGWLVHNTWSRNWASLGRAFMPFRYTSLLWESWRAVDA